ncbi:NADH:ubiquinone oxidoreductase intermediate-associated protein [Chloropicon primus]|uniref:NADH:ubiquinone oxidoreductase intermediate-associated protein n=1 Tax=Chloropicon primus TaxID=1764295 RepID=A0A5B8MAT0_9CHLO|nr:NADH:ubiquinone oxidoreductase intermediate-associated protein [Chloropicon primus]|eukprot:QDZ17558.1 NADH:ubiquinone oxidoreductase intermediate-associated protein [Chloropicon primus]
MKGKCVGVGRGERAAVTVTATRNRGGRTRGKRGAQGVVRARGEEDERNEGGEGTSPVPGAGLGSRGSRSRGSRIRRGDIPDPVLRRRKAERQQGEEAKAETDGLLDSVDPVSLGRRARKEVDQAWRNFTRLGQFASTSLQEYEASVERLETDMVGLEGTGYEVPQALDTRVLVVGGTGQVGRVVLNKLLLRGYTVRALVTNLSDEILENFPPSVELVKGDVSVKTEALDATRDCDKVIFCARARTNLLADVTRVENEGVKNLVTAMLHHKNEENTVAAAAGDQAPTRKNKIVLFKYQNYKKTGKFGEWSVESQGDNLAKDFGYIGTSAKPKITVQMPNEENKSFLFEGLNTDYAETTSKIKLPEGVSLRSCEGLVLNCHGNGKKFAVVLYTEDSEGRHGYISEFSTLGTGFCTRRIPFSAFTRLNADQPPLNLNDVKDFGLRYRSAWNKTDNEGQETSRSRSFRMKVDWVKALPSGPESDVILVSCSGSQYEEGDRERLLKPKRAGEAHLRNSGLGYTVVRASSLVDAPGGQKALLFDQGSRLGGSISSADVADVCIRCLHSSEARNKTFEFTNESDQSVSEFELVAHIPDKTDYVTTAVQGLEKNT